MTTYQKFKKLNIGTLLLVWSRAIPMLPTTALPEMPRSSAGPVWMASTYCTIPEFGEMIFAVSPMNFGDCVHPIAHSFEDLLRLLLSCGSMDARSSATLGMRSSLRHF